MALSAIAPPTREAVASNWDPDSPFGVILTGELRLSDGSPVEAHLTAAQEGEYAGQRSGAPGTYVFSGLRPGDWTIKVRGDRIAAHEETITLTTTAIQRHDLVLEPSFPVRVTIVTPDGADARMAAMRALGDMTPFSIVGQRERFAERYAANDYGAVRIGDARWDRARTQQDGLLGTLTFRSLPAHIAVMMRHLVLQQQVVSPGQEEVRFVVDVEELQTQMASATIRVLHEPAGLPLAGARVRLKSSGGGGIGGQATTDDSGRAIVERAMPGLLRLSVSASNCETLCRTVELQPGQQLDLGEMRLGRRAEFRGVVLGPDGQPAGARVQWQPLKGLDGPTPFRHNYSTTPDSEGAFELPDVGPGLVAVQAYGDGDLRALGVFDCPTTDPITLQLAPTGKCRFTREPDPTRAFVVTIYDAQRRPLNGYAIAPSADDYPVRLPHGTYSFEIHEGRKLRRSGTLQIGSEPIEVVIQ
ncbi:unnamed protein product [Symbiodinium sp. KB8]|nr:unnamed protein product [Symbiodinium sp. KB8]